MGACVSSHGKPSCTMKVHVSSASNRKSDNHLDVIPPSPIKDKHPIINGNVAVKPQWPASNSRDFGSKDETFFDSQAWLDSDCESDFMSVNGEFTPSRGSTPVHHNFHAGTPPMKGGAATIDGHKISITPSDQSPSPIKKKKRLSELFEESLREDRVEAANENVVIRSLEAAPLHSGGFKPKRERLVESVQMHSCLPSLLSGCRPVTPQQTEVRRKLARP